MASKHGVVINRPNSVNYSPTLNMDDLMGTWYVTHSTLPLWKNMKDVTISYSPISRDTPGPPLQFDDVVEYRRATQPRTSALSRVAGVDTVLGAATCFKWRGRGLLFIASSRWQLLGHRGADAGAGAGAAAWAVTFFERTLFTPAGLDIYARTPAGLPADLVDEIVGGLRAVGGDVARLAEGLFEVPRSPEDSPSSTL
ncbi:hypothetical protein BC834DRAFT_829104 [Gloeopeniophorella convolvens]|nr:hypothetical protein BC834DRAFT_829104 [Gloeopeniophorella convolvens]